MPGSHRKETVLILALSTLKKRNLPNTSPKYTLDFCFMTELHIFPGMVFHTSVLFPKNIQLFGFLSLWALNLSSERLMVPTFNTALSGQRHAITFYNSVTRTVAIHHLELSLTLLHFSLPTRVPSRWERNAIIEESLQQQHDTRTLTMDFHVMDG